MTRFLTLVTVFAGMISVCYAADEDPFAEGAKFEGKRFFKDAKGKQVGDPQIWSLKVTERKGNTFKGEITLGFGDETADYPVEGTAPTKADGLVKFKGEKGAFKQEFSGKYKKGEIGLDFRGISVGGGRVYGTALLRPKN